MCYNTKKIKVEETPSVETLEICFLSKRCAIHCESCKKYGFVENLKTVI